MGARTGRPCRRREESGFRSEKRGGEEGKEAAEKTELFSFFWRRVIEAAGGELASGAHVKVYSTVSTVCWDPRLVSIPSHLFELLLPPTVQYLANISLSRGDLSPAPSPRKQGWAWAGRREWRASNPSTKLDDVDGPASSGEPLFFFVRKWTRASIQVCLGPGSSQIEYRV
jgi:hypothetical protein